VIGTTVRGVPRDTLPTRYGTAIFTVMVNAGAVLGNPAISLFSRFEMGYEAGFKWIEDMNILTLSLSLEYGRIEGVYSKCIPQISTYPNILLEVSKIHVAFRFDI
jgi:hypothetical protein